MLNIILYRPSSQRRTTRFVNQISECVQSVSTKPQCIYSLDFTSMVNQPYVGLFSPTLTTGGHK